MRLPVPWLNYVYTRTVSAREFYRHTMKRDPNGTERLWHFWARKSVAGLFISVAAGGASGLLTAFVLLLVLDQFGFYLDLVMTSRAVAIAISLGFFACFMVAPPHRPRVWD